MFNAFAEILRAVNLDTFDPHAAVAMVLSMKVYVEVKVDAESTVNAHKAAERVCEHFESISPSFVDMVNQTFGTEAGTITEVNVLPIDDEYRLVEVGGLEVLPSGTLCGGPEVKGAA